MKPSIYSRTSPIVVAALLLMTVALNACAEKSTGTTLLDTARQKTIELQLTTAPIACIEFEVLDSLHEGWPLINAREIHNTQCGGDPETSPRLFSIAINEDSGQVWSDAKSLLGQMELVDGPQ